MSIRKRFIAATLMTAVLAANAAEAAAERYDLKDGSTLFVQSDGAMRMVDLSETDGDERQRRDGAEGWQGGHNEEPPPGLDTDWPTWEGVLIPAHGVNGS